MSELRKARLSLAALLAQAYPAPEWALFYEVSNASGHVSRRADAVALGIWPSRGHALIGFEFKEDRRDWLREKANPAKAEKIANLCDSWYVVAGQATVVSVEELPEPWGLYVANEDRTKLLRRKPAVPFPDRDYKVLWRSFAAAMLRKVPETMVPKSELERLVEETVQQRLARTRESHAIAMLQQRVANLEQVQAEFKAITGLDMQHWRGPKAIARAVDAILSQRYQRQDLERAQKRLELAAKEVAEALAAWPELVSSE